MTAVPTRKLTIAEYLEIERSAERKSEFYNGEMFAMAGASRAHNRITENLSIEIGYRLKGSKCQSYSSDMRVRVKSCDLFTYPDLILVCGEQQFDSHDPDSLINPTVIIETLSPSTERYDRIIKFVFYKSLESLREYILVYQDQVAIEHKIRQSDGTWTISILCDRSAELVISSVPVSIPLSDIFRDVEFPEQPRKPHP